MYRYSLLMESLSRHLDPREMVLYSLIGRFGIGLDKNGTVYVCDTYNNRIQIFT